MKETLMEYKTSRALRSVDSGQLDEFKPNTVKKHSAVMLHVNGKS